MCYMLMCVFEGTCMCFTDLNCTLVVYVSTLQLSAPLPVRMVVGAHDLVFVHVLLDGQEYVVLIVSCLGVFYLLCI